MDELTLRIKLATATLQELRIGSLRDRITTEEMDAAIEKLREEIGEW